MIGYNVLLLAAVFDINKVGMAETDQYNLVFVRYLINSHKDNITFLTIVSRKQYSQSLASTWKHMICIHDISV